MTLKTQKEYKGFKFITYKTGNGYETFIFNGGIHSVNRTFAALKGFSISFAESWVDDRG